MESILKNPYRTIGLLVGATAPQQVRQIKRLKQLIDAEQEPEEDFSFPILGQLNRTVDSVTDAASKLNLDSDKINAAIFWFYNGSHTDEPAFDAIKVGDLDQVLNIWSKLTSTTDVTQRNASAYNNLSTLYLSGILEGTNSNEAILEQGISLKLKFLESDFIKDFKALATDETFKTTKKDLQLIFLNQVQSEVDKNGGVTSKKFLEILNKQTFSAKDDFLKGFVQKPIEQIEKKIEETKTKRKANKANAFSIGKALYEQTSDSLSQLKSILGISNIKLSSITDKVADEILQCGIDYFQYNRDNTENSTGIPKEHSTYTGGSSNGNFAEASMDLFRKAKTLSIGNIAKQRCQENTENLQEWIDEKPERDKQAKIVVDFETLKNLIDEYDKKSETVTNAKQLLASARPYLNNVKNVLGSNDELYLGLSSRIASDAQGMLVSEVNKLQEKFSNSYDNATKIAAISLLKQKVNEAYEVTTTIGGMDLRQDFRVRYTTNRNSLSNLKTQLANVNTGSGGSSTGCYIATMAYGNYDHPQVMVLREFRDEVLSKSQFGKWFIKTYYHYSPKMVEKMKNKKVLNTLIRKGLNQFIKLIK
jgi:hypothetical protein